MQKEITRGSDLFNEAGRLIQTGWARRQVMNYNRERLRASMLRIKEWDCYCLLNPDFGLSLIIADVGYFGMATVDWQDFKAGQDGGGRIVKLFTRGRLGLPRSAGSGDASFEHKGGWIKFTHSGDPGRRILSFDFPCFRFRGRKGITGQVSIYQDPRHDTMVNVIPFQNPKHFVYVQKVVCMPAEGEVRMGAGSFRFEGEKNNSWAALDWSRGVFPYRTEWWWSYASGKVNGKYFGFNIDYGFGTESNKSMLFYDGRGHHLDGVSYTWDETDLMRPWRFTSNDGRVSLALAPVHKQSTCMNMLALGTSGKHAYGFFTGEVVLDDGTKLRIKESDKVFGSAEYFRHRW